MDALVALGIVLLAVWFCEGVLFLLAYRLGRNSPDKPRTSSARLG